MSVDTLESQLTILDENTIRNRIYSVRGLQVMLDFELAEIYGYTTKAFNQQVKRNIERFPEDFMFRLTDEEFEDLRSQIVTSSWGGTRYTPYAFTEQGIYMLMTVLKGELAVSQSQALIRIFKKMKDHILSSGFMLEDRTLQAITVQTINNSNEISEIRDKLTSIEDEMIKKSDLPEIIRSFGAGIPEREQLILNGEVVEASLAYMKIYKQAKNTIYIIDDYIGLKTLHLLKDIDPNVSVIIFSDNKNNILSKREFTDFQREYPNINVAFRKTNGAFHDRFIVMDFNTPDERIYHCGASSKDAGRRVTTIVELFEHSCYNALINTLLSNPVLNLV